MKARRWKPLHCQPKADSGLLAKARGWMKVAIFPFVGFASLLWFLVRVVPKPSRASYPCQRVAAPLASSFVLWLLGVSSAALAFRKARERFRKARTLAGILCLGLAVAGIAWAVSSMSEPARAEYPAHPPNNPIGEAQGLYPGRVVWAHDPAVTDWAGPGSGERWYEHVDQGVTDRMVSQALRGYTGAASDAAAWDALFRHFNGGTGYTPGEKIVIKINLTTANARTPLATEGYEQVELELDSVTLDSTYNGPQLLHALLDQLVHIVGVAEEDITLGDPTGLFINTLFDPLHADFPDVHYWDNRGSLGRTQAELGTVPLYWSTAEADGTTQDYLPVAIEQAAYLINFAVLKSHHCTGITVNAKNHYGSLLRCPDGYLRDAPNIDPPPYNGYYNMHYSLPGDNCCIDPQMRSMGHYRALVDLMGHEGIGGKTLLYLIDGLFGGKRWYSEPSAWEMPPFNGDWPSSLFLSMDPVAIESVARDFLSQQWPEDVLMYEGMEDYLHEAALADDPPSGTAYDPERDGIAMASLGVHEHWNNPVDKQYSRNLGTGDGIELLALVPPPDLALTKAVAPSTVVSPGMAITFTLAFQNAGPCPAEGVVITDVLPAELTAIAFESNLTVTATGSLSYTWQVGTLPPAQGGRITITGVVSPGLSLGRVFTNTARIASATEEMLLADNEDSVRMVVVVRKVVVYLPLVLQQ
ncbi:MAG: DUF362 domain-containing protein [Anaerolineae bacterium]